MICSYYNIVEKEIVKLYCFFHTCKCIIVLNQLDVYCIFTCIPYQYLLFMLFRIYNIINDIHVGDKAARVRRSITPYSVENETGRWLPAVQMPISDVCIISNGWFTLSDLEKGKSSETLLYDYKFMTIGIIVLECKNQNKVLNNKLQHAVCQ